MKRIKFIRYLKNQGCSLVREGAKHSLFKSSDGKMSTVPRHTELKDRLCQKICKDLDIPDILKRS